MTNSITVFIFSITIAILAFSTSYSVTLLGRSVDKKIERIESTNGNTEMIQEVTAYINKVTLPEKFVKDNYTVNFEDLSSKFDLNFMDFTLFSKSSFSNMLKHGISWSNLQEFRVKNGFTTNINIYRDFFLEGIEYEDFFTVYSLPNINNMSDLALEQYVAEVTGNKYNAENFKKYIQNQRVEGNAINKSQLNGLMLKYGKELVDVITTIPSWNKTTMNSTLLNKSYSLTDKSQKYYLGNKTTFWKAIITEEDSNTITELIYKWVESQNKYKLISLKRIN